jgi:hypothetical protein
MVKHAAPAGSREVTPTLKFIVVRTLFVNYTDISIFIHTTTGLYRNKTFNV